MDYKITILPNKVKVEEKLLPEIMGLYCSIINDDRAVFDATAYMEEAGIEPIDIKSFMRLNKYYIEKIAQGHNLKTSELFYQNTDGHYLVDFTLAFLFLAFVNPDMLRYFNSLLGYLFTDGVAYSNGFLFEQASRRLPTEVLQDIIEERKEEDGTGK